MAQNPIRTVVWSTGGVGSTAIDAIRRRPDLELVGVWVHSPEKAGRATRGRWRAAIRHLGLHRAIDELARRRARLPAAEIAEARRVAT